MTVAKSEVLIRRPIDVVFAAFVEPDMITKFWLNGTTGPLAPDATVHWTFMVEGAEADTTVKKFLENEQIVIEWSDGTTVDFRFSEYGDSSTVVSVENSGFPEPSDEAAIEATQGFTIVLCDLKALLESGSSAGLAKDKAELIASQK